MNRDARQVARVAALVAAVAVNASAQSRVEHGADADRQSFERLRSLVGTWAMTERDNPATRETVTYTMTGRGTVLIENMEPPASSMGHMLTAYHLDKGRLVLTHFCGAGNQPRMRLSGVDDGGRRVSFTMYDITGLTSPTSYHSTNVEVMFHSESRVDITYRGRADDTQYTQVFQLEREEKR